jgi:hypothetical protein
MAGNGNNVLIGGFVVRGTVPVQVLIRAQGASLANYGLSNTLSDTVLDLYRGSTLIATNDDWKTAPDGTSQQTAIMNTALAPGAATDSAILITLQPGAYTTILHGKNGATGIAIVEAFLTQ